MKKYFKKLKIPILIQIFFSILYSITETLFPLFNRYLFDNIMIDGLHLVVKLIILYVIVIICNCFFQYVSRVYEWKVQRIFMLQIKNDLFNHIVSLSNNEFGRRKPSDYLSIFNNNVEVISEDYISGHIDLVKSSLNILTFTLALLFFVDWRITLVILTSSIIIVFLPRIMKKTLSKSRSNQLKNLKLYFRNVERQHLFRQFF